MVGGGGRLEINSLFLSRTHDSIPFHSIPIQSNPFHSIPNHSIPFHSNPFHSMFYPMPNRTLGFVWRNVKTKMSKVRETAYNTLVMPQLEYASAAWDPHNKGRISPIEQVQRSVARWTVNNFERQASVTRIVQDLGWRTFDQRRLMTAFVCFIKLSMVWLPYPSQNTYSTATESLGTVTP